MNIQERIDRTKKEMAEMESNPQYDIRRPLDGLDYECLKSELRALEEVLNTECTHTIALGASGNFLQCIKCGERWDRNYDTDCYERKGKK